VSQAIERFPLVIIVGPTAVGKTAVSLRLASEIRAEIISVDSVQIYRSLDIGSAKPNFKERNIVPHHLIDVANPDEPFDAANFTRLAWLSIKRIISRGRVPMLVGGTGLYLRALFNGLSPSQGAHPGLRLQLKKMADTFGAGMLYDFLTTVDKISAEKIHPNDIFRLIRAIEIYISTGIPPTSWHKGQKSPLNGFPRLKIGLIRDKQELYEIINKRVDQMMEEGLLYEVKTLLKKGYAPRLNSLQTLGYRHIIAYFTGELSYKEAIRQLKRDTRHYAKRQLTWFKSDPEIKWFHPDELIKKEKIWPLILGKRDQR
jgi:tRNA dimethylallyltransferase